MGDPVSKTDFRNAMARVCAPVNIITTNGPGGRGGFTATAMCSVTDEPPTILVCMNGKSAQTDLFLTNKRFCVNVLPVEHETLAGHFAGGEKDMEARYAAAEWTTLPSGTPALKDAIVYFDCEMESVLRVGTHNIMIGKVIGLGQRPGGSALLYFDRGYVHVPSREIGSFGG
jgi:flavin reductase